MTVSTDELSEMRQRVAVAGWSGAMPRDLALDLVRLLESRLGKSHQRTKRDESIRDAAREVQGKTWAIAGAIWHEMRLQILHPHRSIASPLSIKVAATLRIDRRPLTRKQIARILRNGHGVSTMSKESDGRSRR